MDVIADEPAPDYDDEEKSGEKDADSSEGEEDYVELRKTVKNRISAMLNRDEWNQIMTTPDEKGEQYKKYMQKYSKNIVIEERSKILFHHSFNQINGSQ